jgi:hypothetical protein
MVHADNGAGRVELLVGTLKRRQRHQGSARSDPGGITCLDSTRNQRQAVADDEIDRKLDGKEFPADQITTGLLRDTLRRQRKLVDAQDLKEGSILNQGNKVIGDGRNHDPERLGQHDKTGCLKLAEPQRKRCFALTHVYRQHACAYHLGQVSSVVKRYADHREEDGANAAGGKQVVGAQSGKQIVNLGIDIQIEEREQHDTNAEEPDEELEQ